MEWRTRSVDADAEQGLVAAGYPPLLARVYAGRGITDPAELDTRIQGLITDPPLTDMERATQRLVRAIRAQERICIVGDFDCDGATATALCHAAIRRLGGLVDYIQPDRFQIGYGLTPAAVEAAEWTAPDLLLTVDNGIAQHDGVAEARNRGMAVIITDHHLPPDDQPLPEADAVINPKRADCPFPSEALAGVGVAFYLMGTLRRRLIDQRVFSIPPPSLGDLLDLVAVGTVADVVPLDTNNRRLVAEGLRRIRAGEASPGVRALFGVAGRDPSRAVAQDLAFGIGPRINAAGRMSDASASIACLLAPNLERAQPLAAQLNETNEARRNRERSMTDEALADQAATEADADRWGVVVADEQWHEGIVGLVAGRVRERRHRPTVACAPAQDGAHWKGSGRSVPGVHIRDVLARVAAQHPATLDRFGGHAAAAGMTIPADQLATFRDAFDRAVAELAEPDAFDPVLAVDGPLSAEAITLANAETLAEGGPWGQHFPEPVFVVTDLPVAEARVVGQGHLKLTVDTPHGQVDAIHFNGAPDGAPPSLQQLRAAATLEVNEFRGRRRTQLCILERSDG